MWLRPYQDVSFWCNPALMTLALTPDYYYSIEFRMGLQWIPFKSNGTPNWCIPALESSEGTQTSKKAKMESSGGTWIGFRFQLLLLYPQTHQGAAKWPSFKYIYRNHIPHVEKKKSFQFFPWCGFRDTEVQSFSFFPNMTATPRDLWRHNYDSNILHE